MLSAIARYFSYIFHGLLALFLIAVSGIALGTGPSSLHLDMLPWTGATLTHVTFFGGLFGLLTVILAFFRKLPVLFVIWSWVVVILLIKGYIFSGYGFGPGDLSTAIWLTIGALIATIGPLTQLRPDKKKR